MRVSKVRVVLGICLTGLAAASPTGAAGKVPSPVSPGLAAAFAPVASLCPTFSWTAVEGAAGYELVVYEAPAGRDREAAAARPASAEPVMRHRIEGAALAWTPPADGCLALAGSYAWSVRALGGGAAGDWSEAALFRVEPAVAVGELAAVVERAVGRYLESRGLEPGPPGELAALIAAEAAPAPAAAPPPVARRFRGGQRVVGEAPATRGVFVDDVELWLEESGSGSSDKVQLVFATPGFDGDPADAWAIIYDASSSASETGKMFFSTPSFFDALQLFTDGTAIIGDLREFRILPSSSPPVACTSALLQGGMLYYDSDLNELCDCNGTAWQQVDGGGGCS